MKKFILILSLFFSLILTSNSYAVFSGARITHSITQSIPDLTFSKLNFNTERFDTDNYHDNVNNNTRLVAPFNGYYLVFSDMKFANNVNGRRSSGIYFNDSVYICAWSNNTIGSVWDTSLQNSCVWYFKAGDYIELRVFQDSGGNLSTIKTESHTPELGMAFLGD